MESKAVLVNAVPPYGYIIANEKWRGSVLEQGFKGILLPSCVNIFKYECE